jgi:hypothetical protein
MPKKKLSPADEKFIAKFLNADGKLNFDAAKIFRENRFTGEKFEVDPICAKAIDFVFAVERAMQFGDAALKRVHPDLKMSNAVMNFDRARMLVCKLDTKVYMGILD